MTPTLTAAYAGIITIFYVALSGYVIATRARTHVKLGDGGDPAMLLAMRRHGNMAEYAPLALLVMGLAEMLDLGAAWLHASGLMLIAGQFLHPFGLHTGAGSDVLRIAGMLATFVAILILPSQFWLKRSPEHWPGRAAGAKLNLNRKDISMKYLALIYGEDGSSPVPGEPGFDDYMQGDIDATKVYEDAGIMLGGEALHHTSTATSIRIRDGKMEKMDGPFAETKERLDGYYLLDCTDLDQAIEMAALIPDAKCRTVELRPIMELDLPG